MAKGGMRVEVVTDFAAMSRRAADLFLACVRAKPDAVVCLATGASPALLYELLTEESRRRPDTLAQVRVVKLDEWRGLPMDHPSTCECYLQERFLQPCRVRAERYLGFRSDATDADAECARIARALQAWGGIDLAVLGLGLNGHLGLNEPRAGAASAPHVVELAEKTTGHAMLRDHGAIVRQGMTLGVGDLLAARQGLLLVNGAHKREVLASLLAGANPDDLPAALLRDQPQYVCICDRDAAGTSIHMQTESAS